MKLKPASKPAAARNRRKPTPRVKTPATAPAPGKGDIARSMFAQWDNTHRDPRPLEWEKLRRTLEENRLRESPLFSE